MATWRKCARWNVLHFLGGIEKRRHKIVTSPDWTGTTFAGRGEMVTPGSVGTPGQRAMISSVGVDPAGTVRRTSAPVSDGAHYRRAHSCVRNLQRVVSTARPSMPALITAAPLTRTP